MIDTLHPAHDSLMTVVFSLVGVRRGSQINRVPVPQCVRPDRKNVLSHGDRIVPSHVLRNGHSASRPPQTQAQQRPPPWNVTNRQRPPDRDFPYRNGTPPANNRRGSGCWICGTYGCHSANHRPQAMAPQYTDRTQPSGNPNGLPRSGQRQPTYTGRSWNQ